MNLMLCFEQVYLLSVFWYAEGRTWGFRGLVIGGPKNRPHYAMGLFGDIFWKCPSNRGYDSASPCQ